MDQLKNQISGLQTTGVNLVAGSAAGVPSVGFGSGLHRELANLVEIGMSPTEALQAVTSQAAAALDRPEISQVRLVVRDGRVVVDERD